MISGKCFDAATSLFNAWFAIDSARRFAGVGEKEKAEYTVVNARTAVYDAGSAGVMTESEVKALNDDLNTVVAKIREGEIAVAKENLGSLSEQAFITALEKVIQCECGDIL